MLRAISVAVLALLVLLAGYFLLWPVPIEPIAWQAPVNPGYAGPFERNERLTGLQTFDLGGLHGPEDIALDGEGRIYAATHEGVIIRLDADGRNPVRWVDTGGRPLGIDFDAAGNLIVADAYRGLLSVDPQGRVNALVTEADGVPIRYADDVDVAADGRIFFSDASTRFGAADWGGTYEASLLDLMEHSSSGRLLVYDPVQGTASTVLDGLSFANGVAVDPQQQFVLVTETGKYRVIRYWLQGSKIGLAEPVLEELPGFPDNITAGQDGRFWVALASPRNAMVDAMADQPFWRKVVQRLPAFLRPQAVAYGHIIAIDGDGNVLEDLQDPAGSYPVNTNVTETDDYLYVGSLVAPVLPRLPKARAGID